MVLAANSVCCVCPLYNIEINLLNMNDALVKCPSQSVSVVTMFEIIGPGHIFV